MNIDHSLALVAVTAACTLLTRALPFLLFGKQRQVPRAVLYLGRALPPAVMAVLVVYSLRHVSFAAPEFWVSEVIGVLVTAAVHVWRRNTLLSIGVGTAVYMVLVQGVFF